MSDKPPAEEKLSAAGVLDRLLAYASSPWKAGFVLIAIIVCGAGWIVWTERARIADVILTRANQRAVIDEQAFIEGAANLLRQTRGDMALLVSVDLVDNLMTDLVGIDTDGNRWVPIQGPQQALQPASSMPLLVRFLANEVVCFDSSTAINEEAKVFLAKGYHRMCMVSVPPILGVGVGGLVVAWKQAPLPANEQRAGYAMQSAALKFATW